VSAEYDPLVDDCEAFVERVRREGGVVDHHRIAGMVHGFLTLGKLFPEANAVVALAAGALQQALAQS